MTREQRVTATVDRMRRNVAAYLADRVRVTRDSSDPDTWTVNPATGELTKPAATLIWEGAAVINETGGGDLDRLHVGVPEPDIRVGDVIEILQAARDIWTVGDRWLVDDVASGTHHVMRQATCVRRPRTPRVAPDGSL